MSGWELVQYVTGEAPSRAMWEVWGFSSMILGLQFALTTAILTGLDLSNPGWWRSLLLPSTDPERAPWVTIGRVLRMLPTVVRNYCVAAAFTYLSWNLWLISFGLERWSAVTGFVTFLSWFPRVVQIVGQLVVVHWISQLWFWSAHRFVHSNGHIFRFVHAAHHKHIEAFALTAIDCTVSEMILLNMPAVILPMLILQPDVTVQTIWVMLAASHVPLTHSGHVVGYGYASDAYHCLHHRYLNCNYGSAFLDKLSGSFRLE